MLAHLLRLESDRVERGGDVRDRAFGAVDHDPDLARLETFDVADHEVSGGDPLDLLVGRIACQRHVDDLAGEGGPAQVVRGVEQQQLAVAEQADDVAFAGLADVLRRDHQ